jgi:biopolymer transport protein ExbD
MRLDLDDQQEEGFNLTPLVDVVFLLLVFFLVATTFAKEEVEMDLELPEAGSGEAAEEPHLLIVNVLRDGVLKVDGREVSVDALRQKLRAAADRNKDQEVQIRGDTDARHGRIVEVVDACLAASLERVSFAALPTEMR